MSQQVNLANNALALPDDIKLTSQMGTYRATAAKLEISKTKPQQVKGALQEAESRFSVLFDHAPIPFFFSRIDGTLADSNRAAEKFTGY